MPSKRKIMEKLRRIGLPDIRSPFESDEMKLGNKKQEVKELQGEVKAKEKEITNLEDKVKELDAKIDAKRAEIDAEPNKTKREGLVKELEAAKDEKKAATKEIKHLKEDIADIKKDINDIQKIINKLLKKLGIKPENDSQKQNTQPRVQPSTPNAPQASSPTAPQAGATLHVPAASPAKDSIINHYNKFTEGQGKATQLDNGKIQLQFKSREDAEKFCKSYVEANPGKPFRMEDAHGKVLFESDGTKVTNNFSAQQPPHQSPQQPQQPSPLAAPPNSPPASGAGQPVKPAPAEPTTSATSAAESYDAQRVPPHLQEPTPAAPSNTTTAPTPGGGE